MRKFSKRPTSESKSQKTNFFQQSSDLPVNKTLKNARTEAIGQHMQNMQTCSESAKICIFMQICILAVSIHHPGLSRQVITLQMAPRKVSCEVIVDATYRGAS